MASLWECHVVRGDDGTKGGLHLPSAKIPLPLLFPLLPTHPGGEHPDPADHGGRAQPPQPMYFFPVNLSSLDIFSPTTTVPKLLSLFLLGDHILHFPACFLQMYLFHSLNCSEAFILVVMAYDCYVAICRPLHYPVHMTPQTNTALAASAWITALLLPVPAVVQTSQMAFDSIAYIYHCFCDHLAVVR
ncbi:olfactory receptor 2AT4 [Sigmodon hispidus]